MSFQLSGAYTGSAQSGFTSPTYTFSADIPVNPNARSYYCTALGGTQAGVGIHTVSNPFTISMSRPPVLRVLGVVDPVTGQLRAVPMNVYTIWTRKGVSVLAGQPVKPALAKTELAIPAGADTADPAQVRALLSAHFGVSHAMADNIATTVLTGTV